MKLKTIAVTALIFAGTFAYANSTKLAENFKLYDKPRTQPNSWCDVYTAMTIQHSHLSVTRW